MAAIDYLKQIKYTGNGPLDAKASPVETVAELNNIPVAQRYKGMTVPVLDDGTGKQADYWLNGNLSTWEKKTFGSESTINISGDDVETA